MYCVGLDLYYWYLLQVCITFLLHTMEHFISAPFTSQVISCKLFFFNYTVQYIWCDWRGRNMGLSVLLVEWKHYAIKSFISVLCSNVLHRVYFARFHLFFFRFFIFTSIIYTLSHVFSFLGLTSRHSASKLLKFCNKILSLCFQSHKFRTKISKEIK